MKRVINALVMIRGNSRTALSFYGLQRIPRNIDRKRKDKDVIFHFISKQDTVILRIGGVLCLASKASCTPQIYLLDYFITFRVYTVKVAMILSIHCKCLTSKDDQTLPLHFLRNWDYCIFHKNTKDWKNGFQKMHEIIVKAF